MFPLAVRCSMNNFLLMPSSQWIKPKSETLVEKQEFQGSTGLAYIARRSSEMSRDHHKHLQSHCAGFTEFH